MTFGQLTLVMLTLCLFPAPSSLPPLAPPPTIACLPFDITITEISYLLRGVIGGVFLCKRPCIDGVHAEYVYDAYWLRDGIGQTLDTLASAGRPKAATSLPSCICHPVAVPPSCSRLLASPAICCHGCPPPSPVGAGSCRKSIKSCICPPAAVQWPASAGEHTWWMWPTSQLLLMLPVASTKKGMATCCHAMPCQ
ncbi:hypothetical protein DL95DRAFT_498158 [Leptodontidium sp. 2 PMI_412]|nr:hypothetical protein DL95DRAFT_498158 [Leptodontidium sp. 2 PMI_412]